MIERTRMKISYVAYAVMALAALLIVVAVGLLEHRIASSPARAGADATSPEERKRVERRRGAAATAPVADTTTQP